MQEKWETEQKYKKKLAEAEELRIQIEELERERISMQDQVYAKDHEMIQETKRKFETEQEIEKYTRKGKQPQRNSGQRKNGAATHKSVVP